MANDLTQNPLVVDTTVSDGSVMPGGPNRIAGFKFVASGASATVLVKDHTSGHVIYDCRIAATGTSSPYDHVNIEVKGPGLDVTISNGVLYIYEDSGER